MAQSETVLSEAGGIPKHRSILKGLAWILASLFLVLAISFGRSFDPASVLFANDAPLGVLVSQESTVIQNFSGGWQPLNWLGTETPSALPNITYAFYLTFGALTYAKFFVPFTLLLLGLSVWFFFRRLGFSSQTAILGAIAAALNTDPFSMACWGLAAIVIAIAAVFGALGMMVSERKGNNWIKYCLAGACVGMGVMEGYDVGAILSLYVASFVLFQAWVEQKSVAKTMSKGAWRLLLVAGFAVFLSVSALSTLIGTQIKGIVGTQQDSESKEKKWTEATLWSLPPIETLRVVVPGLFGYRMDTANGGNYWGAVGQQPGWEEHHQGQARHSGSGVYAGVLVAFLAVWALFRSFRKADSIFSEVDRKYIWFWGATALISLLFAFGWHAPFYRIIYQLPYFSTIRNPIKFMHPFGVAIIVLFGYGLEGLRRISVEKKAVGNPSLLGQFKSFWAKGSKPDRHWILGSAVLLAACMLGTLIFISSRPEVERHLNNIGFPNELASQIFHFGTGELGWFLLFLALSVVLVALILSGCFSGPRAKWPAILLGILLVSDLSRANSPWIVYYNYQEEYAANPVLDILREKPYERRVTGRFFPFSGDTNLSTDTSFARIYYVWWLQQLFPYYNIPSLDIVQMPRIPEMDSNFLRVFTPTSQTNLFPIVRLWQLTDTQYQIGDKGVAEFLNQAGDPLQRRFRLHKAFDFALKPGKTSSAGDSEFGNITTVLNPNGHFAVTEFTGALPRAKLFSTWRNVANEQDTLKTLADPKFDPLQTVLVMGEGLSTPLSISTNGDGGKVEITKYTPKGIELKAQANAPAILLLNDRFTPDWKVLVDGKVQPLLRCNYIMRGVSLSPGEHRVEFSFHKDVNALYISLAAIGISLVFGVVLLMRSRLD